MATPKHGSKGPSRGPDAAYLNIKGHNPQIGKASKSKKNRRKGKAK